MEYYIYSIYISNIARLNVFIGNLYDKTSQSVYTFQDLSVFVWTCVDRGVLWSSVECYGVVIEWSEKEWSAV